MPATFENGAWRPIPPVPAAGSLPPGWSDGYFAGAGSDHILTTHLSEFTLLHDRFPPPPPRDVVGVVAADGLTLRWAPGNDASGPIAQVQLYVDGALRPSTRRSSRRSSARSSPATRARSLHRDRPCRELQRHDVRAARAATARRAQPRRRDPGARRGRLPPGTVDARAVDAPTGTVLAPADVEVLPLGSAVDLTVSAGPGVSPAPFQIHALGPSTFRPTSGDDPGPVAATEPATTTVVLLDSRGQRIASWSRTLHAGLNHPRLRLPTSARNPLIRHPGRYSLSWDAQTLSKDDRASDRVSMLVVAPRHALTREVRPPAGTPDRRRRSRTTRRPQATP